MTDYKTITIHCYSCEATFVLLHEMLNHHLEQHEKPLPQKSLDEPLAVNGLNLEGNY